MTYIQGIPKDTFGIFRPVTERISGFLHMNGFWGKVKARTPQARIGTEARTQETGSGEVWQDYDPEVGFRAPIIGIWPYRAIVLTLTPRFVRMVGDSYIGPKRRSRKLHFDVFVIVNPVTVTSVL
jgi:hypothetical protein